MNALRERAVDVWVQLTAEPKKAAVLGTLMVVAFVMVIRAVVMSSGGPPRAAASSTRAPAPLNAKSATDASPVMTFRPQGANRLIEAPPISRDLFALDEGRYPPAKVDAPPGGKSGRGNADESNRAAPIQSPEEQARSLAGRMSLRSTILGVKPMAIIEHGESDARRRDVIALGGRIGTFRLVEITHHWVELEHEGGTRVRLEHAEPIR
ncbi:MAG: hypothetical protein EA379_08550 [Phycisphaerales bacterium]|nr:MAG: hypothetical protein EA379_08550 [Phycisphaerales bacterium]